MQPITFTVPPGTYEHREYVRKLIDGECDLIDVPLKLRTTHMCRVALRYIDGKEIVNAPSQIVDYPLCVYAVRQSANAVFVVPESFRCYSLYEEAMISDGECILTTVNNMIKNGETCVLNGNEIKASELLDYHLYKMGVIGSHAFWRHIPENIKNTELAKFAVTEHGSLALHMMTEREQEPEVCLTAICRDPKNILYVKNPTNFVMWLIKEHRSALVKLLNDTSNDPPTKPST